MAFAGARRYPVFDGMSLLSGIIDWFARNYSRLFKSPAWRFRVGGHITLLVPGLVAAGSWCRGELKHDERTARLAGDSAAAPAAVRHSSSPVCSSIQRRRP